MPINSPVSIAIKAIMSLFHKDDKVLVSPSCDLIAIVSPGAWLIPNPIEYPPSILNP